MRLPYVLVDVFTEQRLSGNQLAVFTDVDEAVVATAQMQALALEMSLSETTFVLGRGAVGPRVRIFTPELELPFAGHPTLGTAAVVSPDEPVTLELNVGRVAVAVARTAYGWRAELTAPPAQPQPLALDGVTLAARIGLDGAALDRSLPVESWSCGNAFALLPLVDRAAVARAVPSSRPPAPGEPLGIVAFALDGGNVHARVFIPGSRVPEDSATGSANAPLCAYLHHHGRLALGQTLTTAQGVEMRRPSTLWARMERDADGQLRPRVAGGVVRVGSGVIEL